MESNVRGQPSAAKLLRQDQTNLAPGQVAQDRKSLLAEANILQRLQHPHVVRVFAVVEENELVSGTLATHYKWQVATQKLLQNWKWRCRKCVKESLACTPCYVHTATSKRAT